MNLLKLINQMKRTPRLVLLRISATDAKGETKINETPIKANKITSLAGNGLTGFHLYKLAKQKRCELVHDGATLVFEILPYVAPVVPADTTPEKVEVTETVTAVSEQVGEGLDGEAKAVV